MNQLILKGITKILAITDIGNKDTVEVSSSCLSEVRYDLSTQTLGVTFEESGADYNYYFVPESVYESLVQARSVGQQFNFIVKGSYFYRRV